MKSRGIVALGFLGALAASSAMAADYPEMKLRLASTYPPPEVSMSSLSAKMWMDEITKRSGGKITFQAFWGGALGKPAEYIGLVEKGAVDLAISSSIYTPGKLPLGCFEYGFPFGPVDPVIVTKAKRQIADEFPQIAADYAKYNIVEIMNPPGAAYHILSKKAVAGLDDFKGKRLTLAGRYFGRWVEPAGITPVVAPAHDRYTMLQTGVVDMDLLPLDLFSAFKVYEQAKHAVMVGAMTGNFTELWVNKQVFDKMPPHVQKLFKDVGREIELKVANEVVPEWTNKIMATFKKNGVEVIDFPDAERTKWAHLIADIPAEWAKEVSDKGYPGFEIVKRYQELTTALGYKWPRQWGKQ
ncbi:MAG: TRAP transporter substrate-binding protein DctP [Rhodospirillales bacterium]|nr:TRAP transporter substrate-binding protein DctP [Rhodospirillales bacterium]